MIDIRREVERGTGVTQRRAGAEQFLREPEQLTHS
jgi:hypothetical protein